MGRWMEKNEATWTSVQGRISNGLRSGSRSRIDKCTRDYLEYANVALRAHLVVGSPERWLLIPMMLQGHP